MSAARRSSAITGGSRPLPVTAIWIPGSPVLLELLVNDQPLPPQHRDHPLSGNWSGYRDCHLWPDLLLIYTKPSPDALRLVRLGSHADLFG